MADERDPMAALNNAKAKEEAEEAGRDANYTQSLNDPDRQSVVGTGSGTRRAGPGEGIRAPFAEDGEQAQTSIFDGKGNESVVMFGENAEGRPAQGTGPDTDTAAAEVASGDANDPGSVFYDPGEDAVR